MPINRRYTYIAFYDLDHTIFEGNSATALVEKSRARGIMSPKQFRHAVYLSFIYKLNLGDPTKMINRMLTWLKGVDESSLRQLCLDVFNESLVETIRPEILQSIEEHRNQNGAVVLLSSATLPICEPVSKYLHMDDVICTHLESANGNLTGHTKGKLIYGKEKKKQMLSFCKKHNYDPRKAYYYGDSYTDHYVMEAVGNPVVVAPEKRLLKTATARNWTILVRDR